MAGPDSKYKGSYISQDELDNLLKEADSLDYKDSAAPSPTPDSSTDGDLEEVISQDDIDALLNLADNMASGTESKDDDVISQDDIDALLAGNTKKTPKTVNDEVDDDSTDLDLVTPEDIVKLLKSETQEDGSAPNPVSAESDFDTISQEDLNALSAGMEIKPEPGQATDDDDDSLISQDDIDALLSGAKVEKKKPAPVITPIPIEEEETGQEDSLISQDDIDRLLAGAASDDVIEDESAKDDSNLISQEDIDKLLIGKSKEEETDETLIDQEDIDRLLSAAAPLNEGGFNGSGDVDKLISQEDIDKLLNEDFSDSIEEEESPIDQVILEQSTEGKTEAVHGKPSWHRSKLFISAAAVALVLMVSVTAMMIFSDKPEPPPDVAITEKPAATVAEQAPDEASPTDQPYGTQKYDSIMVAMNGFVVPAPSNIKGLAYIALDLTFEISDAPSDPIKDYEPFFRNIVYEVLNKAFLLQSEGKIVEADLKKMIRDALNDALSEGSIARVDFIHFKVG